MVRVTLPIGKAREARRLIAVTLLGFAVAGAPGPLLAQASGACDGPE